MRKRCGARALPAQRGPSAFDRRPFGGLVVSLITLIEGEDLNTLDLVEPVDAAYAARALSRALGSTLREREIRVLTPEDFVIFKLLSTRELDLSDAASVVRALGSDLDSHLIRRELEILVRSIPSYPVLERWEQVRTFGLA